MRRFLARRLTQAVPVLFGISVVAFLVIVTAPGDPVALLVDTASLSREGQIAIRRQLGLENPLPVRYVKTMSALLTGQLRSFRTYQPTLEMVAEAAPTTLLLVGTSSIVGVLTGVTLGVVSAVRPYGRLDYTVTLAALFGLSVPGFWLALMLIFVMAEHLRWLPATGLRPVGSGSWNPIDLAPYLVLPTIVMASALVASMARYTRSSMMEALAAEYVRTARAKGVHEGRILVRHALRNSLITVVTLLGVLVPILLSGSVVVESVFGLPGMGRLAVTAALTRDYPVVITTTMISAGLVVLFNLLTDLIYTIADPRIRLG